MGHISGLRRRRLHRRTVSGEGGYRTPQLRPPVSSRVQRRVVSAGMWVVVVLLERFVLRAARRYQDR